MPKIPVTVYTTPNCMQCESTKRQFDKLGIVYTVEDLTAPKNAAKLKEFREQGFAAAPIVTTDRKIWSGFKYDKIQSLAHFLFSAER